MFKFLFCLFTVALISCSYHESSSITTKVVPSECLLTDGLDLKDKLSELKQECKENTFVSDDYIWNQINTTAYKKIFMQRACLITSQDPVLWDVSDYQECNHKFYEAFMSKLQSKYYQTNWYEVEVLGKVSPDIYGDPLRFERIVRFSHNKDVALSCKKKQDVLLNELHECSNKWELK